MDPMEIELPYYKMAYTAVREAGMTPERVQVDARSAVHYGPMPRLVLVQSLPYT